MRYGSEQTWTCHTDWVGLDGYEFEFKTTLLQKIRYL